MFNFKMILKSNFEFLFYWNDTNYNGLLYVNKQNDVLLYS
jgi:hypothetical protein